MEEVVENRREAPDGTVIAVRNLAKRFPVGDGEVTVLKDISLYLDFGMGQSLHLGWIRVRQTDVSLVMEDRSKARVAAPLPNRARTVAWATKPASRKDGPVNSQEVLMEKEATYVGIDVAKAQVDVAVRPTDDRWEISHDQAGIRQLVSQLKAIEPVMVL